MTIIIANWKSNGNLAAVNQWCAEFVEKFPKQQQANPECQACVCPPDIFIPAFADKLAPLLQPVAGGFYLGSQDISAYPGGAYTGEVNVGMLKDFSCSHAILGHSERRTHFAETEESLSAKVSQCVGAGVTPIFCVGETLDERDNIAAVLQTQMSPLLQVLGQNPDADVVVAYEPVWAIGTGQAATPQIADDAHQILKSQLEAVNPQLKQRIKVVYGGSVTPDNAKDFTAMPNIDGLLVGGASLKAASMLQILANVA